MYLKDPTKRVQYTFRIKEELMEDLKVYAKEKDIKFCPFCGFHVEGGSANDKDLVVD